MHKPECGMRNRLAAGGGRPCDDGNAQCTELASRRGVAPRVAARLRRAVGDRDTRLSVNARTSLGTAALYPRAAQKPDEVPVRDRLDVVLAISPRAKPFGDAGEVRNGLDVQGRLLAAETAVEVAADADVSRVAGNLT